MSGLKKIKNKTITAAAATTKPFNDFGTKNKTKQTNEKPLT